MAFTSSHPKSDLLPSPSFRSTADATTTQHQSWLQTALQTITKSLFRETEPHFHEHVTSSGDVVLTVYDSYSNRKYTFDSDRMASIWVEQRYSASCQAPSYFPRHH